MHHFRMICPSLVFGRSGHHPSVWPSSVIQQTHSPWNLFVRSACDFVFLLCMLVISIVRKIVCTILCKIVHKIILVGPGFEPLTLQHDLFVGPGFNSLVLITCFMPVVSLAYVTSPHKWSNRGHGKQTKTLIRDKNLSA